MANEAYLIGSIVGAMTAITDDTQTKVFTGDATNAARLDSLMIVNLDAIAHTVEVYAHNGTAAFQIGVVEVPADSGNGAGTVPYNLLVSTELVPFTGQDNAANIFMDLPPDWDIELKITTTVTSGIVVAAKGGQY